MPTRLSPNLISWANDIDPKTVAQAQRVASLPILAGPVALMADAHYGYGATVGSVIATDGAIIASAVGVDIGCGMAAVRTDLTAGDLGDLDRLRDRIEAAIPSGVGKGHDTGALPAADRWFADHRPPSDLGTKDTARALNQFGTLGAGNHFAEVCLDTDDRVWLMLHSGSRGIGKILAERHIATARKAVRDYFRGVEDPDLHWFVQGEPEFDAYIADMLWAQDYAYANRAAMLDRALAALFAHVGHGRERDRVQCHHNYATRETHDGREVWVTRKGAIRARVGDRGIIPGSMGTRSYIVRGLGNPESWASSSHGAGRRLGRNEAKRRYTAADLATQMAGKSWLADRADRLVDEIPAAYKDIDEVMAAQADLVAIEATLTQVVNYKGT